MAERSILPAAGTRTGQYVCVSAVDVLRSVLRAEEPPDALATLGFHLHGDAPNLRIDYPDGRADVHEFPLANLATGFVRAWAASTGFARWAAVVIMTDWIEMAGIETNEQAPPEGNLHIEAAEKLPIP